jgi:hypothetical protein
MQEDEFDEKEILRAAFTAHLGRVEQQASGQLQ